jgi:hypothetical protein
MEGRIQAFAGMDGRAMGGQVRNLSLQKRDIISLCNKAKHDFNYPTGRYQLSPVWIKPVGVAHSTTLTVESYHSPLIPLPSCLRDHGLRGREAEQVYIAADFAGYG